MAWCRVSSSNWQSTGLQIRGLQVRILPDPPHDAMNDTLKQPVTRSVEFLQECWVELKKVHWPTRL